ncbi:EAL domain-containing protein [Sphingomonas sp. KR1UV-12]|uniref:EAL domain-containing protein n=1 Tax=Sphingomonas aurea TaxID=3063994 RepID=A0ABT9EH33_9SPHN|nr:EAL domain-containing protein [Sphingomonas sp. KR1UV-12]MDP1026274.1 EAL domain-containing protein [Sphingomonas sp. KR1UV-12]
MQAERTVALVDARGREELALAEVRRRSGQGEALLVITPDARVADRFLDAGAHAFLADPRGSGEIETALRFARRAGLVERRALGSLDGEEGAALIERLSAWIAAGVPCTVVAVALSRLDLVNAAHGRDVVDAAIAEAAQRIGAALADDTLVVRSSGDLFLAAVEVERASGAAAAVCQALARSIDVEGATVLLGSRAGVAAVEAGDDPFSLIARAAEALDAARGSYGGNVRIAPPDRVATLDALAADLHHAVTRGEIEIVFQPQVEIATGRITGVEALARWAHPTLGPIGADMLFAAADRADLGIALSDHIQELTLATAARWPRALGHLRLSLNLTAADVARAGFARLFLDRVDASGFPRGRLTVELTETGMIHELERASRLLGELRAAGCRVAIDDFGTGYSSLVYLKALPLDYVKIDRALARDIAGDPRDRVVIRGVIDIAHALGLAVIAEGVETPQQLALLKAEGCGWYQGFLRAGGLDEPALVAMIEGER